MNGPANDAFRSNGPDKQYSIYGVLVKLSWIVIGIPGKEQTMYFHRHFTRNQTPTGSSKHYSSFLFLVASELYFCSFVERPCGLGRDSDQLTQRMGAEDVSDKFEIRVRFFYKYGSRTACRKGSSLEFYILHPSSAANLS